MGRLRKLWTEKGKCFRFADDAEEDSKKLIVDLVEYFKLYIVDESELQAKMIYVSKEKIVWKET